MSTQRAFVIQFLQRPHEPERFAGRIEHVATGEAAHFASPDELLAFLFRLTGRQPTATEPRAAAAAAAAAPPQPPPTPPSRPARRRSRHP